MLKRFFSSADHTGMDSDRMFGDVSGPAEPKPSPYPTPEAMAFALGKAWARRYGDRGARDLTDALLRGISDGQ